MSKWIIQNFPQNYVNMSYVEVFGGSGMVLFKKQKSKIEVYNDINKSLTTLFRIVRDNYDEFNEKLLWCLRSREEFEKADEVINNPNSTDMEIAIYTAIKYNNSFSGLGNSFSYDTMYPSAHNRVDVFRSKLLYMRERLVDVIIENGSYVDIIKRYDTPNTLFYLDPPYVKRERYYYKDGFNIDNHIDLRNILNDVKGKWILSYMDDPHILDLYQDYTRIKQIKTNFTGNVSVDDADRSNRTELLITNISNTNDIFFEDNDESN